MKDEDKIMLAALHKDLAGSVKEIFSIDIITLI